MAPTKKPRTVLCWACGRLLRQRKVFVEKLIDGHPRILHKACARDDAAGLQEAAELETEIAQEKRVQLGGIIFEFGEEADND